MLFNEGKMKLKENCLMILHTVTETARSIIILKMFLFGSSNRHL